MINLGVIKLIPKPILVIMGFGFIAFKSCSGYPAECLYDSVFIEMKADYTAEIEFKSSYKFNESRIEKYSVIRVPVNSHIDFEFIEAKTVLPDGRVLKLENEDIETISDFALQFYSDSKSKLIYLPSPREGAYSTVAYKLKYKSLLYMPRIFRQKDIPTFNSYLQVKSEIPYTYFASDELIPYFDDDSTLIYYDRTIPPEIIEPNKPANEYYQIMIKPDSVIYDNRKYGFSSWSDVANFYNDMSQPDSRNPIPAELSELAANLTKNAISRGDSLKALLDFVADNIRYISMDIGRGEFMPLAPLEVLNKKYGDCKDQSMLLVGLLRAGGFKADPALIATREIPDIILSHPWPGYFNHVITAVDTGAGYLFLDASRNTCCFGSLPFALRNRRALICGDTPFLDFTLTSPLEKGNDIIIKTIYNTTENNELIANVELELYGDPAFIFYARDDNQTLANVLIVFWGEDIYRAYQTNFKIETNRPDSIVISGLFYNHPTPAPKSNRMLINLQSPFLRFLKNYFATAERYQPYEFDYTFNVEETIKLEPTEGFRAEKDSTMLTLNEKGIKAEINISAKDYICEINKSFALFDYNLTADRYNKFAEFLLIASQISYNSIELAPINNAPED